MVGGRFWGEERRGQAGLFDGILIHFRQGGEFAEFTSQAMSRDISLVTDISPFVLKHSAL